MASTNQTLLRDSKSDRRVQIDNLFQEKNLVSLSAIGNQSDRGDVNKTSWSGRPPCQTNCDVSKINNANGGNAKKVTNMMTELDLM